MFRWKYYNKMKNVFHIIVICTDVVVGVQREKKMTMKCLSVVSSVRSTFITRKLMWRQRRGSVSGHSLLVKSRNRTWKFWHIEKYLRIFKKCEALTEHANISHYDCCQVTALNISSKLRQLSCSAFVQHQSH